MKLEKKTWISIGTLVFVLYLAIHYWDRVASILKLVAGAAFPLVVGCAIAYMVNILMTMYERHYFPKRKNVKSRRIVCLVASFLTIILLIVAIIALIVPQLVECTMLLIQVIPDGIEKLVGYADQYGLLSEEIADFLINIDWKSRIGEVIQTVTSGVGSMMSTVVQTVSSVFSFIVTTLLAFIFSIYLLLGKDTLKRQTRRVMEHYLRPSWCKNIVYKVSVLDDCFHKFIVGQCTEAVILGVLCTIGMLIFRFPYATMIGALIGFTALIPVAGAYIGAGVGAFMILTVNPMQAVLFLIFIVVLQQLEGNIIYPRVVGASMGLPGIWVLAAVTVGGGTMGVTGMLLGVPITAAIYRLVKEDLQK